MGSEIPHKSILDFIPEGPLHVCPVGSRVEVRKTPNLHPVIIADLPALRDGKSRHVCWRHHQPRGEQPPHYTLTGTILTPRNLVNSSTQPQKLE